MFGLSGSKGLLPTRLVHFGRIRDSSAFVFFIFAHLRDIVDQFGIMSGYFVSLWVGFGIIRLFFSQRT